MNATSTDGIGQRAAGRSLRPTLGLWTVFLLCFLPYPMALLIPTQCGVDYRYDIALPVVLWASVIALAGFASLGGSPSRGGEEDIAGQGKFWRRSRFKLAATWLALVFGLILITRWRLLGAPFAEILQFAGLFAIPLYLALAPDSRIPRFFVPLVAGLWLVHALHGLQQLSIGWQVLTVAGNRNWAAAMLVASAPWAWKTVVGRDGGTTRKIVWAFLVGGITLLLAWQAGSRAVFLTTGGYVFLYVGLVRSLRWWRLAVLAMAAIVVAALLSLEGQAVTRSLARDIRVPLWLGTLEIIADHPVAGVGPGNFRRDFADYRLSRQMRSPKMAPVTLHPHNELLHIAAVGGLPLALIWAGLLVCLPWPGKNRFFPRAVHFSAFVLIGCGMLDLTLFRAPTALLALIMLGWHLRGTLGWRLVETPAGRLCATPDAVAADQGAVKPCLPCPLVKIGVVVFLVLVAGLHTGALLHSGWHMREAHLAETKNDSSAAYERYLLAYAALPSNLEALYNAAETALLKLRNPQLAVRHGEEVRRREPALAHINGLMAAAYEQLGDPRKALRSYRREAALFPYDVSIQGKALDRFLRAGDWPAALETRRRLAAARWWHVINQTDVQKARRTTMEFRLAVLHGHFDQAVALANGILALMPPQPWSEPLAGKLAREGKILVGKQGGFTGAESPYWAQVLLAEAFPKPGRRDGIESFSSAASETLKRSAAHLRQDDALAVAEQFRLAGWLAAAIEPRPGNWPPMVEIRWSLWTAVILLPDQILIGRTTADLFEPTVREELKLPAEMPRKIALLVPVRVADLWTRNQIVGDILRHGKANGCPTLGESPTLYFQLFKALSSAADNPDVEWQMTFR